MNISGVIIEYKKASLSLHYRLVKERNLRRLKDIFNEICTPYLKEGKIKLSSGKKVWEVKLPVRWNKGSAVSKILNYLRQGGTLPVYLGDDLTDEDAFSFLKKKKAITVFVGSNKKSKAKYYLKSPIEVKRFLTKLCKV